jgi:hypothetical protein
LSDGEEEAATGLKRKKKSNGDEHLLQPKRDKRKMRKTNDEAKEDTRNTT